MLTYKATNIKTGRYYVGSALNYCLYIGRMGHHHYTKMRQQFQIDLQENPRDFVWEILREDELETRDYEQELLYVCVDDPLCYNLARKCGRTNVAPPEKAFTDGERWNKETREKMSASAKSAKAQPTHKKEAQSRAASATNAKKQPCPQCGMLMNIGNLTKHLKGTRCKGGSQVG
jgi:hypothetical protein